MDFEATAVADERPIDPQLVAACRDTMKTGSLSFFLASKFLPSRARQAIFLLYAWCRHCDDVIDQDEPSMRQKSLQERLTYLEDKTRQCYSASKVTCKEPAFRGFQAICQRYQIPAHYPVELLRGMAMDVGEFTYESEHDLDLYCYRVAGVVGLMSCHILGVTDEKALQYADSLGRAMQLTNIARDIQEDADRGRVYIPRRWCEQLGVDQDDILHRRLDGSQALAFLAQRLVAKAEPLYREGEKGLRFLDWRTACAVAAARFIYAEIGHEVVRRGADAWQRRTWIPLRHKLRLAMKGVFLVLKSIPFRTLHRRHPAVIKRVRSFS